MTLPLITGLYAALLALVYGALGFRVGPLRVTTGISMYDGGNKQLALEIRRHGNFAEHVPFALLLLALIEIDGAPSLAIHILGAVLLISRVVHPFGLSWEKVTLPARAIGAGATQLVTLVAAVWAIVQFFSH
jgi:hypothetical protein